MMPNLAPPLADDRDDFTNARKPFDSDAAVTSQTIQQEKRGRNDKLNELSNEYMRKSREFSIRSEEKEQLEKLRQASDHRNN